MEQFSNEQPQIACIRVPNFCWQVEVGRQPALNSRSALVTCSLLDLSETDLFVGSDLSDKAGLSELIILDHSPDIVDVPQGMTIDAALSRHSDSLLIQADMPLYSAAFQNLIAKLEQLIPYVEIAGPGIAYLDLNGLDRLYGNPAQIIRMIGEAATGFDLRIGVGENKWQSYLASLVSGESSAAKISGDAARFVGSFSCELLPVPYRNIEQLRIFGLTRLADIATIPQGPMEAQFGLQGRLIWQLANGIDDRPLLPRRVHASVSEHLSFPDATVSMLAIYSGIESLLSKAFTRPDMLHRYARKVRFQSKIFQKPPWVLEVAFKEPSGSKDHAISAIKAKLDTIQFPGPLEDIRLTLTDFSTEPWRQESMSKEVQQEGNLRQAVSQLAARLRKAPPIYQVRELEPWSRIPERRHALVQLSF